MITKKSWRRREKRKKASGPRQSNGRTDQLKALDQNHATMPPCNLQLPLSPKHNRNTVLFFLLKNLAALLCHIKPYPWTQTFAVDLHPLLFIFFIAPLSTMSYHAAEADCRQPAQTLRHQEVYIFEVGHPASHHRQQQKQQQPGSTVFLAGPTSNTIDHEQCSLLYPQQPLSPFFSPLFESA
jgi:hypothetical protein